MIARLGKLVKGPCHAGLPVFPGLTRHPGIPAPGLAFEAERLRIPDFAETTGIARPEGMTDWGYEVSCDGPVGGLREVVAPGSQKSLEDQGRSRLINGTSFAGRLPTRIPDQGLGFHRSETLIDSVDWDGSPLSQGVDESVDSFGLRSVGPVQGVGHPNDNALDATLPAGFQNFIQVIGEPGARQVTGRENQRGGGVPHRETNTALSQVQGQQFQRLGSRILG